MIQNYDGFVAALLDAGFSVAGGGNNEGVFGLLEYSWDNEPPGSPIRWHTGDPDTDPWEWRMRVLDERDDIAYAKVFFKKAGYITKAWYPYFLAVRRGNRTFNEAYDGGALSHAAKRIYEVVGERGVLPLHDIKQLAGFEEKGKFDAALTELQMKLYLTICGRRQKVSHKGEGYGWSSTVFCTTETFWGGEVFQKAAALNEAEAAQAVTERVLALNPAANRKKIQRFIRG